MSFGFAVGDVIASIQLFERLATEIRNYRSAPQHFQELSAELHLFQRALARLLQVEPNNEDEREQLELIRAIALHCQRPVQAFIDKMRPCEKSLGHFGSSRTLATIGRRLHWSLVTKGDVDELRKVILTKIGVINMHLGIQQLSILRKLDIARRLPQSDDINFIVESSEGPSDGFQRSSIEREGAQVDRKTQGALEHEVNCHMDEEHRIIRSTTGGSSDQSSNATSEFTCLGGAPTPSINILLSIAKDTKAVLSRLQNLSSDLYEKLADNWYVDLLPKRAQLSDAILGFQRRALQSLQSTFTLTVDMFPVFSQRLLDIHAMMKSLIRSVEAIPLHLTLPIVRLDDALGESWALPYQACQTFEAFHDILKTVVYPNGRSGARHVRVGHYILHAIRHDTPLDVQRWQDLVRGGTHLTQVMVLLSTLHSTRRNYPLPTCSEVLRLERFCSTCERQSTVRANFMSLTESDDLILDRLGHLVVEHKDRGSELLLPITNAEIRSMQESVEYSRHNIYVGDVNKEVDWTSQAQKVMKGVPTDAKARRYLKQWYMRRHENDDLAVECLEICLKSRCLMRSMTAALALRRTHAGPHTVEDWYLQGRAYLTLIENSSVLTPNSDSSDFSNDRWSRLLDLFDQAYISYLHAIHLNPHCSVVWASMGVLYYHMDQYQDSLDALKRSIRLNPYQSIIWYNMGVLYDSSKDRSREARHAYQQALDLELGLPKTRLVELRNHIHYGQPLPTFYGGMVDRDMETAKYEIQEADWYGHVGIGVLQQENFLDMSSESDAGSEGDFDERLEDYSSDGSDKGSEDEVDDRSENDYTNGWNEDFEFENDSIDRPDEESANEDDEKSEIDLRNGS